MSSPSSSPKRKGSRGKRHSDVHIVRLHRAHAFTHAPCWYLLPFRSALRPVTTYPPTLVVTHTPCLCLDGPRVAKIQKSRISGAQEQVQWIQVRAVYYNSVILTPHHRPPTDLSLPCLCTRPALTTLSLVYSLLIGPHVSWARS